MREIFKINYVNHLKLEVHLIVFKVKVPTPQKTQFYHHKNQYVNCVLGNTSLFILRTVCKH
jgi:hypothetical protein